MTAQKAGTSTGETTCRPERSGDAELLNALFGSTQDEVFSGLDPALVRILLHQQSAGQRATYRAAYPCGRFNIVEVDGEPVGRMVTDATHGELRLVDIAILPEWRGRGIGTRLLRALQAEAQAACVPLRLSVACANAGAHRLYVRLGFRAVEATETHVGLRWMP